MRLVSIKLLRPALLALAISGCAAPSATPVDTTLPVLPSLSSVTGSAPSQRDIAGDDIKSDGPLPAKYTELVALQSAVRDQGERGVCTIFTSTALLEHLAIRRGLAAPDFSEQFLQWSEKIERANAEHAEASDIGQVMDNLAARGTVGEALWPYEPRTWLELGHTECAAAESAQPVACFTQGSPPSAALAAPREKLPIGRFLRNSSIKSYLVTHKTPVAIAVQVIPAAWSYPPEQYTSRPGAWERGEVPYPSASELALAQREPQTGHALLIVGWDDDYTVPVIGDDGKAVIDAAGQAVVERGFYIVKNSWGTSYWGSKSAYGAGYGLVSQRYVSELGTAYVVGLPTGSPPPSTGERHDGRSRVPIAPGKQTVDTISVSNAGAPNSVELSLAIDSASLSGLVVRIAHDNSTWTIASHSATAGPLSGTFVLTGDFSRTDRSGPWQLLVDADPDAAAATIESWSLTFE